MARLKLCKLVHFKTLVQDKAAFSRVDTFTIVFTSLLLASKLYLFPPEHSFIESCPRKEYNVCYSLVRVIFAIFQMTISSRVYKYTGNEITFLNGQIFLLYHVKIFSLSREKRARYVVMCGMHFDTIRHFSTSCSSCYFARINTLHGCFEVKAKVSVFSFLHVNN